VQTIIDEPLLKDITPAEANEIIKQNQSNADFVLLDVRTPEEYNDSHIANAINLDFYDEKFQQELELLDRDKTYLVYCRSGSRSSQTFSRMQELEFRNVYHMMNRWKKQGYDTAQ
jgi:rhodanese-related sulfurtransferase